MLSFRIDSVPDLMLKYFINFLSHADSRAKSANAMYSTSPHEAPKMSCNNDYPVNAVSPNFNTISLVDMWVSLSPAQSESVYLMAPHLLKVSASSLVFIKYCKTIFAAFQCVFYT